MFACLPRSHIFANRVGGPHRHNDAGVIPSPAKALSAKTMDQGSGTTTRSTTMLSKMSALRIRIRIVRTAVRSMCLI